MGMSGFRFQMEDDKIKIVDDLQPVGAGKQELPYMKMEDAQYFAKLLEDVDEETLPADEQKERKIMRLLLKIKNGTPPMRKVSERGVWSGQDRDFFSVKYSYSLKVEVIFFFFRFSVCLAYYYGQGS